MIRVFAEQADDYECLWGVMKVDNGSTLLLCHGGKLSCFAGGIRHVGNNIGCVLQHPCISSDDGKPSGRIFNVIREERSDAFGRLKRMVYRRHVR